MKEKENGLKKEEEEEEAARTNRQEERVVGCQVMRSHFAIGLLRGYH